MTRLRHVLLLTALLAVPALRAQDTVTVGVGGQLSAPVGDHLRVPIFADLTKAGATKLGSYTVRVAWNPAVLSYSGTIAGAFGVPVVQGDSAYLGVLRASGVSAAGLGGAFNLFDLQMSPYSQLADTVRVQVSELSAAGTFTDLLASVVVLTSSAPFCPAMGRWGDLDNDATANSRDALAILSNLVGLPLGGFNVALGDVDGDGLTNSRDALILLSYAVGLDIPGQRVLLVAAGACGGTVPQFVILPDTADLVVNQSVPMQVFARDATGHLTTLDNVVWQVADGRVATVGPDGLLIAREPGTTKVTAAIGPGAQVSATVISRVRRGTWYVDAQRASRASVQLGNQAWPFATPEFTFPLAREGDTIRVAPGAVDFMGVTCYGTCLNDTGDLHAGVVVIGDTLPDGTRPILRSSLRDYYTGFSWDGGSHAELRDLDLRGFGFGVYLNGLRALVLRNVRIEEPAGTFAYGVYANGYVDTLILRGTLLWGDSAQPSGYAVQANYGVRYVEVHNSQVRHWEVALSFGDADSLDVMQSQFVHNTDRAIYVSNGRGSLGARISHNRFENTGDGVSLYGIHGMALDHNYFYNVGYTQPIYASTSSLLGAPPFQPAANGSRAPNQLAGTVFSMQGDSIRFRSSGYDWVQASGWDSVLVDSLWLESAADTALNQYSTFEANYARFTNSRFLNLNTQGIHFNGLQLLVDHSSFTGCAVCSTGAAAVQAYSPGTGPLVTLTNSTFTRVYSALQSSTNTGYRAGPMFITGNQVDSVNYAFDITADSLLFADNVLTRVITRGLRRQPSYGTQPFPRGEILRNQITCSGAGYGVEASYAPVRADSNTILNCGYGLYGTGSITYPSAAFAARGNVIQPATGSYGIWIDGLLHPALNGNRVTGGYYGIYLSTSDTGAVVLDSNAVSGTSYTGVYLNSINASVTGGWNNISGNLNIGLYNYGGTGTRSFTAGRFAGNAVNAVYNLTGTVGAQNNWWGDPAGPPSTGPNSNVGAVDASSPLLSDPGNVPPLAPRFAGAVAAGTRSAPAVSTDVRLKPPVRAADEPAARHLEQEARRAARDRERQARAEAALAARMSPGARRRSY